ncbi:hypothetical protein U1Q18_044742 [Sarracenia purpurea var. burkii]
MTWSEGGHRVQCVNLLLFRSDRTRGASISGIPAICSVDWRDGSNEERSVLTCEPCRPHTSGLHDGKFGIRSSQRNERKRTLLRKLIQEILNRRRCKLKKAIYARRGEVAHLESCRGIRRSNSHLGSIAPGICDPCTHMPHVLREKKDSIGCLSKLPLLQRYKQAPTHHLIREGISLIDGTHDGPVLLKGSRSGAETD